MLYSSFNHPADSAIVWQYGPSAQLIAVGSTAGDTTAGSKFVPLSFEELSRDLIVAGHFAPVVGIYNLEGCVSRGFLPRLAGFDWNQTVIISTEADSRVIRLRARVQSTLWALGQLPYFAAVMFAMDLWLSRWRRAGQPRLAR